PSRRRSRRSIWVASVGLAVRPFVVVVIFLPPISGVFPGVAPQDNVTLTRAWARPPLSPFWLSHGSRGPTARGLGLADGRGLNGSFRGRRFLGSGVHERGQGAGTLVEVAAETGQARGRARQGGAGAEQWAAAVTRQHDQSPHGDGLQQREAAFSAQPPTRRLQALGQGATQPSGL